MSNATSKNPIKPVRGMKDLMGLEAQRFRYLTNTLATVATKYGCQEIATPIVEPQEVFKRSLGDTSDVVSKEMYTLEDRKGTPLVLRPEGTAGVCRAFAAANPSLPARYWYQGPMFRYERPQKGRQRQFHQLGAEFFGEAAAVSDVDGIMLATEFLKELNINNFSLEINSLGDKESRSHYHTALVAYLTKYQTDLSTDSQTRLQSNPLRVLDSKDVKDREIVQGAPKLSEYLNKESQAHFEIVTNGLKALSIPYTLNEKLVRGLDYYNHTVFECVSNDLGAQGTILAGGRYDGLVEQLGGNPTAGFGWAAGMERLELLLPPLENKENLCALLVLTEGAETHILNCLRDLRVKYNALLINGKNLGKLIKKANNLNASHVAIMGQSEVEQGSYTLKDLASGSQETITL